MIAEESANYNRRTPACRPVVPDEQHSAFLQLRWKVIEQQLDRLCGENGRMKHLFASHGGAAGSERERFRKEYLPHRLDQYRLRLFDRAAVAAGLVRAAGADDGRMLARLLEKEFYKDDLERRRSVFQRRLSDRTVHPTQMYSIRAEQIFERIIPALIRGSAVPDTAVAEAADELAREHLGLNVSITSGEEADEILLDLDSLIAAEQFSQLSTDSPAAILPLLLGGLGWQQSAVRTGAPARGFGGHGKREPDGAHHEPAAADASARPASTRHCSSNCSNCHSATGASPACSTTLRCSRTSWKSATGASCRFRFRPKAARRVGMTLHITSRPAQGPLAAQRPARKEDARAAPASAARCWNTISRSTRDCGSSCTP